MCGETNCFCVCNNKLELNIEYFLFEKENMKTVRQFKILFFAFDKK